MHHWVGREGAWLAGWMMSSSLIDGAGCQISGRDRLFREIKKLLFSISFSCCFSSVNKSWTPCYALLSVFVLIYSFNKRNIEQ